MEDYFYESEPTTKTQLLVQKLKNMVNGEGKDSLKAFAMFVVGLTVMQPYHASISGSRFAIKRFRVPGELSSIYVSKFHLAFHTLNVSGIILINVYMWFYGITHLRFNPLISVFTGSFVLVFNICLLVAYAIKRSAGALTLYYTIFCLCSLCAGINQSIVASVGVEYLAFFVCGLQFTGIWVTFYHSVFLSISKVFPNFDVDYWIITFQILIASLISLASILLWNNCFGQGDLYNLLTGQEIKGDCKDEVPTKEPLKADGCQENVNGQSSPRRTISNGSTHSQNGHSRARRSYSPNGKPPTPKVSDDTLEELPVTSKHTTQPQKPNLFASIRTARSPILMSAFSMAVGFFFYPSVAPYKLATLEHAHRIDLSVLIIAAVPPLTICALCLIDIGPNKKWDADNKHWHYFWYIGIPYVMCPVFFLVAMHYPNNGFSRFVKNPYVLGILTDLMIVCYSILKSVGYSGAGLQEEKRNGTVSTFNMMFSFLFLIAGSFWGSGYIEIYNRYERSEWPTKNMFFLKAFFYWATHSFEEGFSNFTTIFSKDLLKEIMDSVES